MKNLLKSQTFGSKKNILFFLTIFSLLFLIYFFMQNREMLKLKIKDSVHSPLLFVPDIPEQSDFCGEKVPLDSQDARERLDREILSTVFYQSQTLLALKRSGRWFPEIEPILRTEGVPEDFKYLPVVESWLDNLSSPAGAKGFWQLTQAAARSYGLEINDDVDQRYDLEKATVAACSYLKDAYSRLGSWTLVAASYNMGIAGLKEQMSQQRTRNFYNLWLNSETGRYVFRIVAFKEIFSAPEKYGYRISPSDYYAETETELVKQSTSIANLSDFAIAHSINLKILKTFNPWLRSNRLPVKAGKKYDIRLPKNPEGLVLPD